MPADSKNARKDVPLVFLTEVPLDNLPLQPGSSYFNETLLNEIPPSHQIGGKLIRVAYRFGEDVRYHEVSLTRSESGSLAVRVNRDLSPAEVLMANGRYLVKFPDTHVKGTISPSSAIKMPSQAWFDRAFDIPTLAKITGGDHEPWYFTAVAEERAGQAVVRLGQKYNVNEHERAAAKIIQDIVERAKKGKAARA